MLPEEGLVSVTLVTETTRVCPPALRLERVVVVLEVNEVDVAICVPSSVNVPELSA